VQLETQMRVSIHKAQINLWAWNCFNTCRQFNTVCNKI